MITHPSKRVAQPVERDPGLSFPDFGIDGKFVLDARPGSFSLSPDGEQWRLHFGATRLDGRTGEAKSCADFSVQSWPRAAAPGVGAATGLSEAQLLKFVYSGERLRRYLGELEVMRDAVSGAGPFPIRLYRSEMESLGGMPPQDFPEEGDMLQRAGLGADEVVLMRVCFRFRGAEILVLGNGSAAGTQEVHLTECGRDWEPLRFPQLQAQNRSALASGEVRQAEVLAKKVA